MPTRWEYDDILCRLREALRRIAALEEANRRLNDELSRANPRRDQRPRVVE